MIETVVYHRGRVLHRQLSDYCDLSDGSRTSEEAIRNRVEDQHRAIIEAIESGQIAAPATSSDTARPFTDAILVRLRNGNAWLARGQASLEVEVLRRGDSQPISNAKVEAKLSGSEQDAGAVANTGNDGIARLQFAIPPLAGPRVELMIRAEAGSGSGEVRYALRSRSKPSSSESKS
ncbi:MAG TPA: hypothetical protein VGR81_05470 [Candidatus Acidoferrales bacterium]|nr:hypothetical protein [Candidatus Acidoferrales bacterium]